MLLKVLRKLIFSRNNISKIVICSFVLILVYNALFTYVSDTKPIQQKTFELGDPFWKLSHETIVHTFFERRKALNTSNLGSLLFKNELYKEITMKGRESRMYIVLIWKFYKDLSMRHIFSFDKSSDSADPLSQCSVTNCLFIGDDDKISDADAVVVHLHRGVFPNDTQRYSEQRWIFLSDEAPIHTFARAKRPTRLKDIAGVFNWSMTYRTDSDVPVPYGRVVPLEAPKMLNPHYNLTNTIPFWHIKRSDVHVAVLVSHCVEFRMNYIKKLQEFIDVDIYGQCSDDKKESCPGYFSADCKPINKYIFYLSFENSMCHEYITEKVFYQAYSKGAIPVIMGPSLKDCETLLPPFSYIHVSQFDGPKSLANKLLEISQNEQILLKYHRWRNHFEVVNEHGYFMTKSVHYCRICQALNYNSEEPKVYGETELQHFLDHKGYCKNV